HSFAPESPNQISTMVVTSPTGLNSNSYLDTGGNAHITNDLTNIGSQNTSHIGDDEVQVGNGECLCVQRKGQGFIESGSKILF
ncbi:hypothetical protein, partial [Escherichia coli]|uniref:hypothetical protein n=1 Tax=Escherichia coli TaxID=562 RepID=UPI003F45F50E